MNGFSYTYITEYYSAIKRNELLIHQQLLKALCYMKKASLIRLHTTWSHAYDILEKTKLQGEKTDARAWRQEKGLSTEKYESTFELREIFDLDSDYIIVCISTELYSLVFWVGWFFRYYTRYVPLSFQITVHSYLSPRRLTCIPVSLPSGLPSQVGQRKTGELGSGDFTPVTLSL